MKHTLFKAFFVATLVAAFSTVALGQVTYAHQDGGVQFTAPKDWKVSNEGNVFTLISPDELVAVMFAVVDLSEFESAAEAVSAELDKQISDVAPNGEGSETKINGLDAFILDGKGKVQGRPVEFGVAIIMAKKPVFVLGIVEDEGIKKHERAVSDLMASIRPAK